MPASAQLVRDDREAFAAFYQRHVAFVWRTLRRFGVAPEALEDATQDVFVIAHRRAEDRARHASEAGWLHGVARRVASNHRRGRRRHVRKLEAVATEATASDVPGAALESRVGARRHLAQLAAAIDALPPARREVYVLAELEGMSAPEIADALGCKVNTVYSRLRRARSDLEPVLAPAREPEHVEDRARSHDADR